MTKAKIFSISAGISYVCQNCGHHSPFSIDDLKNRLKYPRYTLERKQWGGKMMVVYIAIACHRCGEIDWDVPADEVQRVMNQQQTLSERIP